MRYLPLLLCLLAAYGCGKAKDEPEPASPSEAVIAQFQDASARLRNGFLDHGTWVCSRTSQEPSNNLPRTCEHAGEAILWSGEAMAALSCADGQSIEDGLIDMVTRNGGALVRVEPLGEYAGGREITLDGAIGFYRGVAHRALKCPGSLEKWQRPIALHLSYLAANDSRLNAASEARLEDEVFGIKVDFSYPLDLLAFKLGLKGDPGDARWRTLEREVAAWAAVVNLKHAAAYRVNLGFVSMETVEEMGENVSQSGRNDFCAATRGVDIPTVDQWCGRGDLEGWVSAFKFDEWEYRHQRSGSWEAEPDGNGLKTPGLDLLVALRQAYTIAN